MTGWNGFDLLMLLLGIALIVVAVGLTLRFTDARERDSGDVYGATVDALGFDPMSRR